MAWQHAHHYICKQPTMSSGLQVHAWTLRDEKQFVLEHLEGDVSKELDLVLQVLKADGVFVDSPKTAASWLDKLSGKEWDMPVSKMQGNCRNAQH